MTESLSDYAEANVPAARQKHPEGWEPSVTWNGKKGVLSTGPLDSAPDAAIWDVLIKDWGLDPTTPPQALALRSTPRKKPLS